MSKLSKEKQASKKAATNEAKIKADRENFINSLAHNEKAALLELEKAVDACARNGVPALSTILVGKQAFYFYNTQTMDSDPGPREKVESKNLQVMGDLIMGTCAWIGALKVCRIKLYNGAKNLILDTDPPED